MACGLHSPYLDAIDETRLKEDSRDLLKVDRFSIQPLTILGVTGPFSVLAENIYALCADNFGV